MEKKDHLPETGVGPYYVVSIIVLTIAGIYLSVKKTIHVGMIKELKVPFCILGAALIISGVAVYICALINISDHIVKNELVTTGIYAYTRNPIYTAFLMVCTGALLIVNDVWLFILPILYWLALTILMKLTEEKWLKNLYGEKYIQYCKCVNRCIPWKRGKL